MTHQHSDLAQGRWATLPLVEQMAHIGSEVERALNWKAKGNASYSERAFGRALELIDLSLANLRKFSCLKELARTREALVDHFAGTNQYESTEQLWRKYFSHFALAVRRDR